MITTKRLQFCAARLTTAGGACQAAADAFAPRWVKTWARAAARSTRRQARSAARIGPMGRGKEF